MILTGESMITEAVIKAISRTCDPRLKEILECFVRYSHAFVREVHLTSEEYEKGIRFLADLGHYTNDTRNEMVQAGDVLGISSLVMLLHNPLSDIESAVALLGPFYRGNAPMCERDESISRMETEGEEMIVSGHVLDIDGTPLQGAVVDIWQASPIGLYDNQDPTQPDMNMRGRFTTAKDGTFRFRTLKPKGYPVPTDGPIGRFLEAQGRHAFRPAHLHFVVSAEDHETLITQVYTDSEKAMVEDVVFGVTVPLVGDYRLHQTLEEGVPPGVTAPYYTLEYDFKLKPGVRTFPAPPIA